MDTDPQMAIRLMSPEHPVARYMHGMGATLLTVSGFLWLGWGYARVLPAVWEGWLALYVVTAVLLWVSIHALLVGKRAMHGAAIHVGADMWRAKAAPFKRVLKAEAIGCGLVVMACLMAERWDLLAVGISLVVGLHFMPLARVLHFPAYAITGFIVVVGALVSLMYFSGNALTGAVGAITGATVWATAIFMLFRLQRLKTAALT
ncbi:MAG TPA: hypothetical protein VF269_06120 [Rhodanobacteraceae bacterium]